MDRKIFIFILVVAGCIFLSGCSILNIPFKVLETAFNIVGEVFKLAEKVPIPPPGTF